MTIQGKVKPIRRANNRINRMQNGKNKGFIGINRVYVNLQSRIKFGPELRYTPLDQAGKVHFRMGL